MESFAQILEETPDSTTRVDPLDTRSQIGATFARSTSSRLDTADTLHLMAKATSLALGGNIDHFVARSYLGTFRKAHRWSGVEVLGNSLLRGAGFDPVIGALKIRVDPKAFLAET